MILNLDGNRINSLFKLCPAFWKKFDFRKSNFKRHPLLRNEGGERETEGRRKERRKRIIRALRKKKVTISGYKTPSKPSANKRQGTNWTQAHKPKTAGGWTGPEHTRELSHTSEERGVK